MRRQLVEPRIRHSDLADIRLDRAEGIVRRLRCRRLRQRIEERRLADIRQADDAAFETHDFSSRYLHCHSEPDSSSSPPKPFASMARYTLF